MISGGQRLFSSLANQFAEVTVTNSNAHGTYELPGMSAMMLPHFESTPLMID